MGSITRLIIKRQEPILKRNHLVNSQRVPLLAFAMKVGKGGMNKPPVEGLGVARSMLVMGQ